MEPNQIKNAHILDILFEGRNKEYGAYELRKTYNRRMVKSMVVMGTVVMLVMVGGVVSGLGKGNRMARNEVGGDVELIKAVTDPPPVVPPPPKLPPPPVAQIRMTKLVIVPDNQVQKNEQPPENAAANDVQIGTINRAGDMTGDIVGPPATDGVVSGVVTALKKTEDDRFIPVEKEAEFPGGPGAWGRFLNRNLRVPDEAVSNGVNGMVVVQFVVDVDGSVSDVTAISGPEEGGLKEEAVRVIKKSGKWVPALQNGRSVRAYRRQPVVFRVVDGN